MKRRPFAINFEQEHLNRLVLDENSCVILKQCTHHLALHPYHLTNINESLKTILNQGIAKYDKILDGILLGYENLKFLSTVGSINNDTCFIHVDISADFYLFNPEVGRTLMGIVNKKSEDHVGCLVHEVFNVSLPKPADEDDWIGSSIDIGQEILFKINLVDLEGRLPYIRAMFVSIVSGLDSGISTGEDSECKNLIKKKSKGKKTIFKSDPEDQAEELVVKKNKKKRKSAEFISDEIIHEEYNEEQKTFLLQASTSEDMFVEDSTETYKKKKRKRTSNDNCETSYEEPTDVISPRKHSKKKQKLDETQYVDHIDKNTNKRHKTKRK